MQETRNSSGIFLLALLLMLFVLLLFLEALLSTPVHAADMECEVDIVHVIDGDLALHARAAHFSSAVDLKPGMQICIISARARFLTKWYQVRTQDGQEGWIDDDDLGSWREYSDSLPTDAPEPAKPVPTYTATPTIALPSPTLNFPLVECEGLISFVLNDAPNFHSQAEPHENALPALEPGTQVCIQYLLVTTENSEIGYIQPNAVGTYKEYLDSLSTLVPTPTLSPTPTHTPTLMPTNTPRPWPTNTPTAVVEQSKQFNNGIHLVPGDIEPGLYFSKENSFRCYWARLAGFSGGLEDIISNGFTSSPEFVRIKDTDRGFESGGCGIWLEAFADESFPVDKNPWGDGAFRVGLEIDPGTYRSLGTDQGGCYWERLNDFTGEFSSIIANGFSDNRVIVTLKNTDVGFRSNDCGGWERIE